MISSWCHEDVQTPEITSVYRNQKVLIRAIFQLAGDTRQVLCLALDHAKRKHLALICDGNGMKRGPG